MAILNEPSCSFLMLEEMLPELLPVEIVSGELLLLPAYSSGFALWTAPAFRSTDHSEGETKGKQYMPGSHNTWNHLVERYPTSYTLPITSLDILDKTTQLLRYNKYCRRYYSSLNLDLTYLQNKHNCFYKPSSRSYSLLYDYFYHHNLKNLHQHMSPR